MENDLERICPNCGSKERKRILDADEFILTLYRRDTEDLIKTVICAKCGCIYDAIIGGE